MLWRHAYGSRWYIGELIAVAEPLESLKQGNDPYEWSRRMGMFFGPSKLKQSRSVAAVQLLRRRVPFRRAGTRCRLRWARYLPCQFGTTGLAFLARMRQIVAG